MKLGWIRYPRLCALCLLVVVCPKVSCCHIHSLSLSRGEEEEDLLVCYNEDINTGRNTEGGGKEVPVGGGPVCV